MRALLLWFVSLPVMASTVLDFDAVRVDQLAFVLFSEVLRADYVLDSNMKSDPVSVHLTVPERGEDRAAFVDSVLRSVGVVAELQGGVYRVRAAALDSGEAESFVYRPRWRSVPYLVDLVSPLFKAGSFALRRGVSQPAANRSVSAPAGTTAGANTSQGAGMDPALEAARDNGSNALSLMDRAPDVLVFKGTAREVARLQGLLAQIDAPTPEVLVKAMVFEVSTAKAERSALALAASLLRGKLSVSLPDGAAVSPGDYSAVFKSAQFSAIFDALSQDSRFKVVSQPQVRVASGSSGRLIVGTKTPVKGATTITGNGTVQQSVTYQPSGVILELQVEARQDTAELTINQQISQFTATSTGVNDSPTLTTREVQTVAHLRDGEVLVLGGLDQEQTDTRESGPWWLPSFLHAKSDQRAKTEVLVFLEAQRI